MNIHRPRPITMEQIYKSQARVNLVCGFYGPAHPECKKVVDEDVKLYMGFMKQFTDKIDEAKTDEANKTDVLDLLQHMMRDNL